MRAATVDVQRLKAGIDLRDLAGREVPLHRESAAERSGPCPKCGGHDRLHVTAEWFFCRQCHPQRGDAIEWVRWLGLAADFRAACAYLGAAPPRAAAQGGAPAAGPRAAQDWRDEAWQRDAHALVSRAQETLAAQTGERGADYLLGRGLQPATWQAWELGYDPLAWDARLRSRRPALVIPWRRDRETLAGVKFRFLTVPDGGLRYTSAAGSACSVYGLEMAGQHRSTLWLLEGELNALSLWQALRGAHMVNFDVLSFGGEGKAAGLAAAVGDLAAAYLQVIVWADDPEKARSAMRAIPGAFGLRSLVHEGAKLDANELLRRGMLAGFARAAWRGFDESPAFTARLRAELARAPA